MVDVNRIRERAADWLGDVGDAALRAAISRIRGARTSEEVMQSWREWYRSVGAVPSEPRSATAAPSHACGDSDCRMVGQEQNRAGACPAGLRELDALPDEDAATDPSVEPANGGAGPWHGLDYDVAPGEGLGSWVAIARRMASGGAYRLTVTFNGQRAEERAREYAALMSEPLPCTAVLLVGQDNAADNGVWCDRHGGRFADAAPSSGAQGVPLVDGVEAWFGQPSRDLAAAWNKHAGINAKPAFVIAGQRWNCVGVDGALEVVSATGAARTGDVGLAPVGSVEVTVRAREVDMLGLKEWIFLR